MAHSPHAKTVDAYLRDRGVSLEEFITTRRGDGTSYSRIAKALAAFTEGVVDVTGETIRNWANDLEQVAS